jgi:histidyl-tRNA synthetase
VRGLDYYRHTAFEFVTDRLGAQGTVLGGGRYDGLIENMGGPATPAVGWAAGIERLAMLVEQELAPILDVAVVAENREREAEAMALVSQFRRGGISAEIFASGSPKKRYNRAVKAAPRFIASLDIRDGANTEGLSAQGDENDAKITALFEEGSWRKD